MNNKELNNTFFHMSQEMGRNFNVNCTFYRSIVKIRQWHLLLTVT